MATPKLRGPTRVALALAFIAIALVGCSGGGLGDALLPRAPDPLEQAPAIALSTPSQSIDYEGATASVEISNDGDGSLSWSASLNESWASIDGASTGTSTATLSITFEQNATHNERSVTLSVRSSNASNSPQTIQFTQQAAPPPPPPVIDVLNGDYTIEAAGETLTINVTPSSETLQWELAPLNDSWTRVVGRDNGTGGGQVTIEVDANDTDQTRSLAVTVRYTDTPEIVSALNFSQPAQPPLELTINTDKTTLPAAGGDAVITVSLNNEVATWSATVEGSPAPSWVQLNRSDNMLTVSVAAHGEQDNRTFTINISSRDAENSPQSVQFTQEGADLPEFSIQADDYSASSEGQTIEITVSFTGDGGNDTEWSANVSSGGNIARLVGVSSGTGDGKLTVEVDANSDTDQRAFTVEVTAPSASGSPKELNFVQNALSQPTYTVTADDYTIAAAGQQIEVRIVFADGTQVEWTASISNGADHAQIIGISTGSGDAGLVVEVDANNETEQRGFDLTVTAEAATGSPKTLNFVQLASTLPRLRLTGSPSTLKVPALRRNSTRDC